jgi:hypothetical protein
MGRNILENYLSILEDSYYVDPMGNSSSNDQSDVAIPSLDINETKKTTTSRVTSQTKIKRATSQLASLEAKKRNDSDYKNMVYHRDKYRMYLEKIHKKYGSKFRQKARL